jgi:pimeloyl-ACP methyl ester carboxylesterase
MGNLRTTSKISFHPNSESPSASHHLIFFITGNPGLVSYYTTFLSTLGNLLSSSSTRNSSDVFHIHGESLAGFEDESILMPPLRMTPYSLEEQITMTLEALTAQRTLKNQHYATITLIGHSVGAYILLELIARIRKSWSPLNIRGGILLFPTVTHLAQSPRGLKVTPILNNIPDLPRKINLVAKCLVWILPRAVLKWIVGKVASMPDDAAEVTTRFLRSPMGVWQAL